MPNKKNKQATAKKKLAALLAKIEKKKAQIERKTKRLQALKYRVAKVIKKYPALKPPAKDAPKTASRRKRAT